MGNKEAMADAIVSRCFKIKNIKEKGDDLIMRKISELNRESLEPLSENLLPNIIDIIGEYYSPSLDEFKKFKSLIVSSSSLSKLVNGEQTIDQLMEKYAAKLTKLAYKEEGSNTYSSSSYSEPVANLTS